MWREGKKAIPDVRHEVQEVVVDGDLEMARVVVTGTLTSNLGGVEGTGRRFRIDQAVIVHLREGKVAEAWEIADMAALTAQVSPRRPPESRLSNRYRICGWSAVPPGRTAIVAMWCDRDGRASC